MNWQEKIQKEFPFMQQYPDREDSVDLSIYQRYGFECSGGWYELIRECCRKITGKYEESGRPIDFIPEQIKEKFGTLRFYYSYADTPCGIQALDLIDSGLSLRFDSENEAMDEGTKAFRKGISDIVRTAEQKSASVCEWCGKPGELRDNSDIGYYRILTICNECQKKLAKKCEDLSE